jgi:hypothetical protein
MGEPPDLPQRSEITAAQAEMLAKYPYLEEAVYGLLREKFERELPPLPDKDLELIAADEDAQPLEAFIGDLDRVEEAR